MFRTLGVSKNRAAADAIWHQFGSLADHLLKTDSRAMCRSTNHNQFSTAVEQIRNNFTTDDFIASWDIDT